ncbi:hypothetical protein GGS21DRAFT_533368 [Xylaria nigripes]|nr:hypothetical protein GGS21DRAFT_533368 [Xylaria nigripes]
MVEVMRSPSYGPCPSDAMNMDIIDLSNRLMNKSLNSIPDDGDSKNHNGLHVPPRRAFTVSNHILPTAPVSRVATPSVSPGESIERDSYFQPSMGHLAPPRPQYLPPVPSMGLARLLQQQALASPHRSYSVMDYEPIPFTHQPGPNLQLAHLPPELHYAIFDFLEPIDSVCLALTAKHFYAIHWRIHGKVSLAARREGPNDMEWVWRNAGPFLLNSKVGKENSLAMLSPRGQVYCRKCRTARCGLHKHIKEWIKDSMGEVEYCAVTEKYGPPAQENAKTFCYRSSPRHPNRCGRHTRNRRPVRLV